MSEVVHDLELAAICLLNLIYKHLQRSGVCGRLIARRYVKPTSRKHVVYSMYSASIIIDFVLALAFAHNAKIAFYHGSQ